MNLVEFNKKLEEAKNLKEIQGKSLTDEYMRGLYNGMELILSIFESREPKYVDVESQAKDKAKLLAQQVIEDDTKGFKPDWGDEGQIQFYGYYNHGEDCLDWDSVYCLQMPVVSYFKTKEDIKESFDKHRKEWLIMLGVEEEKQENQK